MENGTTALEARWIAIPGNLIISDQGGAVNTKNSKALTTHKSGKVTVKSGTVIKYLSDVIWEEFVGPIPVGYKVTNKDNDLSNNSLSNLELVDSTVIKPIKGKYHIRGTFDKASLAHDISTDMRSSEIAAKYGCTYQHVWQMRKNATKTNEVA